MSQEKTENGSIRVKAKAGSQNTRVSVVNTNPTNPVSAVNTNFTNPVNAANSKAQMYEQMALSHANDANIYAQQAEKSAINSANSAAQASNSVDALLSNEDFIAVNNSLSDINLVSDNIYSINFVAKNQDKIEQIVEDLNNLGDTTNINIVATNISDVNTNAENIISINKVANSIDSVNDVADSISGVNEIANNLTEILNSKTYADNAKISETNASISATIATNKANEAINTVANTLNKTQITNCLLEVPQNIKLELNNGVLTLKKGSKVIVPNGSNRFDEVVINSDINFTYTFAPTTNTPCMVFINASGTGFVFTRVVENCFSGTTQPSGSYRNWYNTTENKMYSIGANATVDGSGFSFPIAIITQGSNGVTTSIDQVFNGFGYIGSTVWVGKGVKGLIPNGRNADGTLKNIEYTTSKVYVRATGLTNTECSYAIKSENSIIDYRRLVIDEKQPDSTYTLWYKPSENILYTTRNVGEKAIVVNGFVALDCYRTSQVISNYEPKLPFRTVDYNEYQEKTNYLEQNSLNKQQITNCLLEVPENIKLELKNGTLTLKAGSKVIVPKGFEANGTTPKFDEVVIASDISRSNFSSNGTVIIFVNFNDAGNGGISLGQALVTNVGSGTSDPNTGYYYRSNENKLYSVGNWWGYSLPICIGTANGTTITSIDQVFNGFGFVGHHTFSYAGIKSLIPNGKNPDGTFKNKETITTSINVRDEAGRGSLLCFWDGTNILTYGVNNYFEQETVPTFSGQHCMWLNTKENVMYTTSDYGATWVAQIRMYLGKLKKTTASGDFVEASFRTPVELVKRAEFVRSVDAINSNIDTIETNIANLTNNKITVDNSSMVVSSAGVLCKLGERNFYKRNEGWAICALVYFTSGYGGPILIGKTADAVKQYNDHTTTDTAVYTLTYKGTTYYFSSHTSSMPLTSDMLKAYSYPVFTNRSESVEQMVQRILLQYYSSTNFSAPVNTYVNGTSWWKMWGDGWIEQGGLSGSANTGSSINVTFLKSFANANYSLCLSSIGTYTKVGESNDTITSKTATGFTVVNGPAKPQEKSWYACGY